MTPLNYPPTPRGEQVDTYTDARGQSIQVPDPYRWLEASGGPELDAWVQAQNALTADFLAQCPSRLAYQQRLEQLWDYPKPGTPWKKGGHYFRYFNPGLLNQSLLQVSETPKGPWRTLLDPNILSQEGTSSLMDAVVSRDGQWLAYGLQQAGSDWTTWRVRHITTGQDQSEQIEWCKFGSVSWHPDHDGFYYVVFEPPEADAAYTQVNKNPRIMFHRLGQPQQADEVVLACPEQPDWLLGVDLSDDGAYLIVYVRQAGHTNRLWVRPLRSQAPFIKLVDEFVAIHEVVGNDGPLLYILTDHEAPKSQLLSWNLETGERHSLIPEGPHALVQVKVVPQGFLAVHMVDASHRLSWYSRQGEKLSEIALPTYGTLMLHADLHTPEVFLGLTSFLSPLRSYQVQLPSNGAVQLEELEPPNLALDLEPYQVTQAFATSRDGTRIPLFIVARKDTVRDGQNRTLLYGYGGFNITPGPTFSPGRMAWLERGGIYVQAQLRGGGEYGRQWHEAGTKERKQNVFDDFIACAEYLIQEGWTSPAKLGIQGRSNGGLLVGACLTQRPELFAAAIPQVGVLDMLRYQHFTIGRFWAQDYGLSEDPALFEAMYAYSPLHNLRPGQPYPATLITTSDHDDRVVPAHSYKFAAQMQQVLHDQTQGRPALLRVQTQGGHGMGLPLSALIQEQADLFAFLEWATA